MKRVEKDVEILLQDFLEYDKKSWNIIHEWCNKTNVSQKKGEKKMEHLKIAIADDNQKNFGSFGSCDWDGKRHESGRKGEKMVKRCVRSSKINSQMLFFST